MAYRDWHVWLTVTLAVFRYIAVCHHAIAKRVCTLRHARLSAVCIVLAAVVVCLPTYLMYQPRPLSTEDAAPTGNYSGSFGFTLGYVVEIPTQNLSMTVFIGGREARSGAASSGYWFEEKEFVGPMFETVNFWVYGVALKTAPCILLTVLSALLIRAMRAAELRHRRLIQRRPVLSSASGTSPRTDTQTCTVRRHHTFEEPKNPELSFATLGVVSPVAWKRSFSERIPRSTAASVPDEPHHSARTTFSADALQDEPAMSLHEPGWTPEPAMPATEPETR